MPIAYNDYYTYAKKTVLRIAGKFRLFFTKEDVEDIIMDVVVRLWNARDAYDPQMGTFEQWVWVIAQNAVYTAAKKKHRRTDIDAAWDEGLDMTSERNTDEAVMLDEMEHGFYKKLNSERDKRFLKWKIEGMSNKEIAKREGVNENTVNMAFYHIRQRLRNSAA